ncbi:TPA_asm: hypothetical protein [Pseudomonas phage vB_PaeS-D14O]|nr:TPA_asm: hypothetical protein [Pseudomonas phage vB_PaeS-D14O]
MSTRPRLPGHPKQARSTWLPIARLYRRVVWSHSARGIACAAGTT